MTDGSDRRPGAMPYVLLTLTMCFWAINNIVSKLAVEAMPPTALAFWSWAIGLAVLTPFAHDQRAGEQRRRDIPEQQSDEVGLERPGAIVDRRGG